MTSWGRIALYVAGGSFAVLALLIVVGWNMEPPNTLARIRDECQKNYGHMGQSRVADCFSELAIRHAQEINQQKMDQTYRNAR